MKEVYGCDGISIVQRNEPATGQDIWHYHMHIYPRYNEDHFITELDDTYWPESHAIRVYADKIKQYLSKI